MAEALLIYKECLDFDFMDYSDTMDADISYILELIDALGITAAREYLRGIME